MQPLAVCGYTEEDIKKALHAPTRMLAFRYELLDAQNRKKSDLTGVLGGRIEYNSLAEIKRTATFVLEDSAQVNYLSDRIKPWVRLRMPTLVWRLEDTQFDWQQGTLMNVVATAAGDLELAHLYGPDDGSSLAGWTVVGATVDTTVGNPAPSFKALGGQYAYKDIGVGPNMVIEFDAYVIPGSTALCNFYFMCDANGAGQMFRLEGRSGYSSGFAATTSWTSWQAPSGHGPVATGVWHHVKLVIGATTVEGFVDGVSYGTFTFTNKGGYVAVHGDASIVTGGYFDNIVIANFRTSGTRLSPILDLSPVGIVASSSISWTATTPAGTSVTVETNVSLDGGVTWQGWQPCTNGGRIPGITPGADLSNARLQVRQKLTTQDSTVTPRLHSLTVRVLSRNRFEGWAEWPQGVFLLNTPPRKVSKAGVVTRQVQAYDLLQILVDDKLADRYTVAAGTNYIAAVKAVLDGAGLKQQNLTPTDKTLPADRDWPPGTKKLQVVNDLLAAINYKSLWIDENGTAVAEPYRSPAERAPEYTYRDDDQSVIFPEVSQGLDLFGVPNKWVLVVSQPDRAVLTSTYTNSNPDSPTSTVSRGRTIVDYREVDAADQASLDAMAARIAFEASQVYEQVEFETAIMPFHSDSDVIELYYTKLGIAHKYSEVAWGFDLKAGARMYHRVRRVVSV